MEAAGEGLVETASDTSSSTTSATSSQEFLDGMPDEIRERIFTVHTEPPEDDTEAAEDDWPFSEWPIPEASSDELRRMLPLDMIDNHAVVFCALHRPDGRPCVLFIIPINQDSMADQGQTIVDSIQQWLQEHDSSPRDPNVYVTTCLPHRAVLNHGAQFDMRMSETDWLLKIYKKMCAGLSTASAGNAEAGEDILRSTRSPSSDRRAREALQRAAVGQARERREQERKDRDMAEAFRLAGVRDQEQRAAEAAAKKRAAAAAVTKIQAAAAAAAKEERQAAAAAAAKEEQREASRAGQRGITRTDSAQARFEENSGADANAKRIADSAARKQAEKEDKKRKREEDRAAKNKKQKQKTRPPAAGGGGD